MNRIVNSFLSSEILQYRLKWVAYKFTRYPTPEYPTENCPQKRQDFKMQSIFVFFISLLEKHKFIETEVF